MSSALRKKRGNTVVWVLLMMVILGLGGFGMTSFSGRVSSIGSVGDEPITTQDYARALQSEMRAMSAQNGQNVTVEQAQQLGLDRAVQGQLFAAAAIDGEARRLGLSAGDEQVRRSVLSIPRFQGIDGKFDREAYRLELRNQGLTEADFEARIRKDAVRAMIERAVASGTAAPAAFVRTLADYVSEERDFVLAELLPSDLPEAVPDPTEAEIKAYYDAHNDAFTSPEIRRLTYVWLSPESLVDTVEVDESELRAAYEARLAEFVTPELRLVDRLVFPNAEEASAAKARIDAGEATFEDIVAERGLSLTDVSLGEMSKDDLGAAGEPVFALTAPGVAGPVDTELGPALFSMNGILPAEETTFEEAKPDLETEARLDRARRLIADQTAGIEDLLASGASLEEVSKEAGMELGSVAYPGEDASGITGYEAFRSAAEAASPDDFPELGQLEDGGIFALRLDGIDPPALKPLDDVREEAAAAWKSEETTKRLAALADDIKTSVDQGGSLAARGLVTTAYERFVRTGHVDAAPPEVLAAVFSTEAGKASVVEADGRVHVVQVTEVHPVDATDPERARIADTIAEQARQGLSQDIFALYAQALESEAGVTIDQAVVNAVHSQVR